MKQHKNSSLSPDPNMKVSKKGTSKTPKKTTSSPLNEVKQNSNQVSCSLNIPKWYKLRLRATIKKDLIQKLVNEYAQPVKLAGGQVFQPTDMDIKDYLGELYKLDLNQLVQIGNIQEAHPKLSIVDKVSKLKKKKALLVSIYHKNGSRTHYVCAKHTRMIKIDDIRYICPPNMGNFDNKYNMMSYTYYENNPFPLIFQNDYQSMTPQGQTVPDGELLEKTMDFEFAQKLAQSSMSNKVNIAMIFSVLAFITGLITIGLCVHGFKLI